eukprot:sb/3477676/
MNIHTVECLNYPQFWLLNLRNIPNRYLIDGQAGLAPIQYSTSVDNFDFLLKSSRFSHVCLMLTKGYKIGYPHRLSHTFVKLEAYFRRKIGLSLENLSIEWILSTVE